MKKLLIVMALAVVAGAQVHAEEYKEIRKQEGCGLSDTGQECGRTIIPGRCAQTLKGEYVPCKTYKKVVEFTCPEVKCCDKVCPACPDVTCPVCPRVECRAELVESCPAAERCMKVGCERGCRCKAKRHHVPARSSSTDIVVVE